MARELTLRNATADDAERVADVLNECTRHYFDRASSVEDALLRSRQADRQGSGHRHGAPLPLRRARARSRRRDADTDELGSRPRRGAPARVVGLCTRALL